MTSLGLTTLWEILDDGERDVEMPDGCENFLIVDEGERLTARIPDEIVHALSEAEVAMLDWVAERWIATDELSDWSASERREVLERSRTAVPQDVDVMSSANTAELAER